MGWPPSPGSGSGRVPHPANRQHWPARPQGKGHTHTRSANDGGLLGRPVSWVARLQSPIAGCEWCVAPIARRAVMKNKR